MKLIHLSILALVTITAPVCLTAQLTSMAKPSDEHKIVMADVGTWKVDGKLFMGDQTQEFQGKEVVTSVGQFWTVSQYKATMFGQPFHGSSTLGWNEKAGKFTGSWVDSMNPNAMHMTGTYDKETKTMTFETKGTGMNGQPTTGKIVVVYKGDGSRTFTMFGAGFEGGTEMVKEMEMTYTKVGGGSGSRGPDAK